MGLSKMVEFKTTALILCVVWLLGFSLISQIGYVLEYGYPYHKLRFEFIKDSSAQSTLIWFIIWIYPAYHLWQLANS